MLFYAIFIIIIGILLTLDYKAYPERYGIFIIMAVAVITIIAGTRYETGYDYNQYYSMFSYPDEWAEYREYGFILLVKLLKSICSSPYFIFFAFSLITIYLVFKGISELSTEVRLSLLAFILIPNLYINSFSTVRQALAIALSFYSYPFFLNKQYKTFILLFIIACNMHISALIILPIFCLSLINFSNKGLLLTSIIIIPVSFILGTFIWQISGHLPLLSYASYFESDFPATNPMKVLSINLEYLFFLLFYKRYDTLEKKMLFLFLCYVVFQNIFAQMSAMTRIGFYFRIYEIILIGNTLKYISIFNNRIIYRFAMIFILCFQFGVLLIHDYRETNDLGVVTNVPYKNIIFADR